MQRYIARKAARNEVVERVRGGRVSRAKRQDRQQVMLSLIHI